MHRARLEVMKLHTHSQLAGLWTPERLTPTIPRYQAYLSQSREVHLALERSTVPVPHAYHRVELIDRDMQFIENTWGGGGVPDSKGPGLAYAGLIDASGPAAFLCHWYCIQFAHMAGGRLLAKMMSEKRFDGWIGEYNAPPTEDVPGIRLKLHEITETWEPDVQEEFIQTTREAFDRMMALDAVLDTPF